MAVDQAKYGIGQYGSAKYGEIPVTAKAPLEIETTGAIYGSAVYGTNTYGGTITETHSGVSATGSVNTVTVTAESSVTLPSASATGSVTTASISADSNINLSPLDSGENDGAFTIQVPSPITNGFSPEFGLTQDFLVERTTALFEDFGRSSNVVMACEVQLPTAASVSEPKALFEHGGTGIGAYVGISKINNVYHLRIRAGEGLNGVNLLSDDTDIAVADVALSEIPEFDGNVHNVAWEFKPGAPGRVRLWIDGRNIISQETSGGAALESGQWSGGGTGEFGGSSGPPGGTGTFDGGATQYQTDTNWPFTPGDLRVYVGELADFGVSLTLAGDANVTLTGVQASGTADPDIVIEADASHTLTSVQGTSATGTVGTVGVAIHQVDGVQATGQATTVTLSGDSNLTIPSTSATSQITTAEGRAGARGIVEGVEATGEIEPVVAFTGVFVTFEVESVDATGFVTTVDVQAKATAGTTGVQATGTADDDLTFVGKANVVPESADATGTVTTATVTADANTTAPSVSATGNVDPDVVIEADANHVITSVQGTSATGGIGDVVAEANIDTVTGVEATGVVNDDLTFSLGLTTTAPSVQATGNVDPDVVIEADANHVITSVQGVGATGGIGDVVAGAGVDTVTGVSATIVADDVIISAQSLVTPESADATGVVTTTTVSADANFTPESADATGTVTTVDISIPKDVPVDGVQATGQVETVTLSGIANFELTGVQATGQVETVTTTADANFDVDGVVATANVDPDIVIEADANHVITSVQGVTANGGVGSIVAGAVVDGLTGVEATGEVDTVTLLTTNVVPVGSVTATGGVTTTQTSADSFATVQSVEAVASIDDVTVVATAVVVIPSVSSTVSAGTLTVTTVQNIFDANNRVEKRTVYVSADLSRVAIVPPDTLRVVDIPADIPRISYVEAA